MKNKTFLLFLIVIFFLILFIYFFFLHFFLFKLSSDKNRKKAITNRWVALGVSCPPETPVAIVLSDSGRSSTTGRQSRRNIMDFSYIKNVSSIEVANESRTTPCDHVYGYLSPSDQSSDSSSFFIHVTLFRPSTLPLRGTADGITPWQVVCTWG